MEGTEHTPYRGYQSIGLGFWQAWQMVVLCTDAIAPDGSGPCNLKLLIMASTTLGYVAAMILSRFVPLHANDKTLLFATAAIMALGTFFMLFVPYLSDSMLQWMALAIGAIGMSLGNSMLLLMWGELWSNLATGRVGQHLYISYTFAFVLYFIAFALPHPLDGLFACTFPIFSCLILKSCENEPRRRPTKHPATLRSLPLGRMLVFIFALSVIWGITQQIVPTLESPNGSEFSIALSMLVAGLATATFALYLTVTSPEAEAIALYQPIVPIMALGLVLLALLPNGWTFLGNGLLTMGIYCLDMAFMLVATDLAFSTHSSVALVFGAAILSARSGTLIGTLCAPGIAAMGAEILDTLVIVSLGVLVFAGMAVFTKADLLRLYEAPQSYLKSTQTQQEESEQADASEDAETIESAKEGKGRATTEGSASEKEQKGSLTERGGKSDAEDKAFAKSADAEVDLGSSDAGTTNEAAPAGTTSGEAYVIPLARRCAHVAEEAGLTSRETEVLELLVRGRTVQDVCDELSIAQGTAKHHVSNIYRKLGVGDRRSLYDIVERED